MSLGQSQMDISEIMTILPHRYPLLLIDRVEEVLPGKSLRARKNVTIGEQIFAGHFPGHPVMPGVIILEAMAQAGALLAYASDPFDPQTQGLYLLGIDRARFRRLVIPGDCLEILCEVAARKGDVWRLRTTAEVQGEIAAEAVILASVGDKLTHAH